MVCRFDIISAKMENSSRQPLELWLNLVARKSLNPRRSVVKSFNPFGLWKFYTLLRRSRINFCLKALKEGALRKEWFKLFRSIIAEGKKRTFKKAMFHSK